MAMRAEVRDRRLRGVVIHTRIRRRVGWVTMMIGSGPLIAVLGSVEAGGAVAVTEEAVEDLEEGGVGDTERGEATLGEVVAGEEITDVVDTTKVQDRMHRATTDMAQDAVVDAEISMDATNMDTDMDVGITDPVLALVLNTPTAMPGARIVRVGATDGGMGPDIMTTRTQTLSCSLTVGTAEMLCGRTSHRSTINSPRSWLPKMRTMIQAQGKAEEVAAAVLRRRGRCRRLGTDGSLFAGLHDINF